MTTEYSLTKFVGGCSTGAYNDPYQPGCLTADPSYVYADGSKVINRPDENAFSKDCNSYFRSLYPSS